MQVKNEIVQELLDLGSPLAAFPRVTPFLAPAHGFEANARHLVDGTLAAFGAQDPALPYPKAMPFTVPAGYFSQLPDAVLDAVQEDTAFLSKKPSFEVPEHYFEQFAGTLLDKIKAEEQPAVRPATRVIPLYARKSLRWAAAAVVLIALGIGAYPLLNSNNNTVAPVAEQSLANISPRAISDYMQNNLDDFDREMMIENAAALALSEEPINVSGVDQKDIVDYLDENGWN